MTVIGNNSYRNKIFRHFISEPWPIPSEAIDLIIFSPPYWKHRDYGNDTITWWGHDPKCSHKRVRNGKCLDCGGILEQLGQEDDLRDYIRHLVDALHVNAMKCLRPDGQMWVNIGDTYSKGLNNVPWGASSQRLLVPYRVAMALQDKGWILRSELIWAKGVTFEDGSSQGGGMPSSVHDRLNQCHEPFFGFVKPRESGKPYYINFEKGVISWKKSSGMKKINYYSDMNSIRIKPIWVNEKGERTDLYGRVMGSVPNAGGSPKQYAAGQPHLYMTNHPLGKNPGSVWQINLDGFTGQEIEHTAPYPITLIERIIKFAAPQYRCSKCKLPLTPIFNKKTNKLQSVICECNAPKERGYVFDPFMGSGTTALAAIACNRDFGGFEPNQRFFNEALSRINKKSLKIDASL